MTAAFYDAHLHVEAFAPGQAEASAAASPLRPVGDASAWVNGTSPEDWPQVRALAERNPAVVPFFGLHPWHIPAVFSESSTIANAWVEALEQCLMAYPSGVGEIGLDRKHEGASAEAQETVLVRQLELARQWNRPVSLHCVGAADWLLAVLRRCPLPEAGAMLHGFSGSEQDLRQFQRLPIWFSFGPRLLDVRQERVRGVFRAAPFERLLLESDAPYGGDAASSLPELYAAAAELRGVTVAALREQIAQNARRFLGALAR